MIRKGYLLILSAFLFLSCNQNNDYVKKLEDPELFHGVMKKLSDVRETIKQRRSDYLVDFEETLPILTYKGGCHYKIEYHEIRQSLVFNEKDICRIVCADRQFDEKEFLDEHSKTKMWRTLKK